MLLSFATRSGPVCVHGLYQRRQDLAHAEFALSIICRDTCWDTCRDKQHQHDLRSCCLSHSTQRIAAPSCSAVGPMKCEKSPGHPLRPPHGQPAHRRVRSPHWLTIFGSHTPTKCVPVHRASTHHPTSPNAGRPSDDETNEPRFWGGAPGIRPLPGPLPLRPTPPL